MRRRLLPALLAALTATTGLAAVAAPAQGAGRTFTVSPGVDLQKAMTALRPGDVLRLNPGTYDVGYVRPTLAKATATSPIVVTAVDPARRPLIRGGLHMTSAAYWRLDKLRVQATVPGKSALYMDGGGWWSVTTSEFTGARATGSYANVVIAGGGGWPRSFTFSNNCVFGAARTNRGNTDHNIYVNFQASSGGGGTISRNVVHTHPQGAGIKLGNGGVKGALGPRGVRVVHNTIYSGGRQVLLHGNVSYNTVAGNLLGISTQPFNTDPRTTAVYVNEVNGTGNTYGHNYVWRSSMVAFNPKGALRSTGDNGLHPDPALAGAACSVRPGYAPATAYGKYGTGRWPAW